ncbi:MAG: hypothetical protein ACTSYO_02720 [Candidatus Ranarchaeia archaeon]
MNKSSMAILLIIFPMGVFLGTVISNLPLGFSFAFCFWLVIWGTTRTSSSSRARYLAEKKKHVKPFCLKQKIDNLQLALYKGNTILCFNNKRLAATALLNTTPFLEEKLLKDILGLLRDEDIPVFYYVSHKPCPHSKGATEKPWQTQMIFGVRISITIGGDLRESLVENLISRVKMASTRIRKTIHKIRPSVMVRMLEEFELLEAYRDVVFAPSNEKLDAMGHGSLWVEMG